MFCEHIHKYGTLASCHPCRVLVESIQRIKELKFDVKNTKPFEEMKRWEIGKRAWEQQYAEWKQSRNPQGLQYTLPPLYPEHPTDNKLPLYMHIDKPHTSARRSRLRFDRAQLNASRNRLGWKEESRMCSKHPHLIEHVQHVLAGCTRYSNERADLILAMSQITLSRAAKEYIKVTPLEKVVMLPESVPNVSPYNMKRLHHVTGKFIRQVFRIRKLNTF